MEEKITIVVCGQKMNVTAREVENMLGEREAQNADQASKLSQLAVEMETLKKDKDYWYDCYVKECQKVGDVKRSIDIMRNVVNEIADRWK